MKNNDMPITERGVRKYLMTLVREKVLLLEAKRLQIDVTKEEVDKEIEREKKEIGSEEGFKNYLKIFRNTTLHEYRTEKKLQILTTKLISHAYYRWLFDPTGSVYHEFVTPSEMKQYYEEHKEAFNRPLQMSITYITFQYVNNAEKARKMELAESLLRKAAGHTDFSMLARLYTDLRIQNLIPQEMRKIRIDNLEMDSKFFKKEINDAIFRLGKGEISDVLDDGKNLYLVKVDEITPEEHKTFEQAQPVIKIRLTSEKRRKNEIKLYNELLKNVKVEPEDLILPKNEKDR